MAKMDKVRVLVYYGALQLGLIQDDLLTDQFAYTLVQQVNLHIGQFKNLPIYLL